jgi:hypothetical protein
MTAVLLAFLLLPAFVPSAGAQPAKKNGADKTTVQLVEYFLKTPPADANPALVDPFLAVDASSLPKKLRSKAAAKQTEIRALVRLHDTRKAGSIIQPMEGCTEKAFVKPLSMAGFFPFPDYEVVNEDELKYVMDKTRCTEIDLGCRFSMLIFFEKKKDRVVKFAASDPIMAIVAESRRKTGSTNFFGSGFSCMH